MKKLLFQSKGKKNALHYRNFQCKQDIKTENCNLFFLYFVFNCDFKKPQNHLKICSSLFFKEKKTLQYRYCEYKQDIKTDICNFFLYFVLNCDFKKPQNHLIICSSRSFYEKQILFNTSTLNIDKI